MTTYIALLRGIMPMNPNMRGEKLREAFTALGFKKVKTVINSGNVIFDSPSKNSRMLEAKIEKALPKLLGFESTTIIRSRAELEKIGKTGHFVDIEDNPDYYPIVTFCKDALENADREIFTALKRADMTTTNFMQSLEKKYGKKITTRTWKTVHRILKKMN